MNKHILKISALILFSILTTAAFAEDTQELKRPVIILDLGNDLIGAQQTDRHLTNSITFGFVTSDIPKWLEKYFKEGPNTEYSWTLSQQMFTPEDLHIEELIPSDRPYAGWLFTRVQSSDRRGNRMTVNAIELGVVGPAALAEELQVGVHKLTGSEPANGWDNQLSNELGVNIIRQEALGKHWDGRLIDQDVVAFATGSLGNVQTHAEVGTIYRIGYNVPDDMAVGHMGGNTIGTQEQQNFSVYVFVGASGRYVVRDIFLDGNTFVDSHSVEKENLVGSLRAGLVVAYRAFELGYSDNYVTEQFKGQAGANHNGVIYIRFKKKI